MDVNSSLKVQTLKGRNFKTKRDFYASRKKIKIVLLKVNKRIVNYYIFQKNISSGILYRSRLRKVFNNFFLLTPLEKAAQEFFFYEVRKRH